LPIITALKGSLHVLEDGSSKGAEGDSSKCQRHYPLFAYKDKKYLGEINMFVEGLIK
jgi:hypothetical protein